MRTIVKHRTSGSGTVAALALSRKCHVTIYDILCFFLTRRVSDGTSAVFGLLTIDLSETINPTVDYNKNHGLATR